MLNKGDTYFISAPYSHPDKSVTLERMNRYCLAVALLLRDGYFPVGPLLNHFVLAFANVPSDWPFWKGYSEAVLETCHAMIILDIPGWETSPGVQGEIAHARKLGSPIYLLTLEGETAYSIKELE